MDTLLIINNIKLDNVSNLNFKGVFARDNLPKIIYYPASFIANTDKSNKKGEHWLEFYYDIDGKWVCAKILWTG